MIEDNLGSMILDRQSLIEGLLKPINEKAPRLGHKSQIVDRFGKLKMDPENLHKKNLKKTHAFINNTLVDQNTDFKLKTNLELRILEEKAQALQSEFDSLASQRNQAESKAW